MILQARSCVILITFSIIHKNHFEPDCVTVSHRSLIIIPNLTEHYKRNTYVFTVPNRIQHPTQNV
jgi:hypothetical protein